MVVNLVLFTAAFVTASLVFLSLLESLWSPWPNWLAFLLLPLFALTFFLVVFGHFALVASLAGSLFYDRLAAQVEELLTGRKPQRPPLSPWRGLKAELGRWSYSLKGSVPLALLSFVPFLNLIVPPLWLLWQAWFLGLEYTAYPLQNRGVLFREQRTLLKKAPWGVMALGGAVMVGLTVPLLNLLMPTAAVIAATIYLIEAERSDDRSEPP